MCDYLNHNKMSFMTKILIVEDESITAMDVKNRLNRFGFDVVGIASRGAEAVKKAGDLKPDLILMDITLKGDMDGIEAAEEIKTLFDIPVVYMSAFADKNTFERVKLSNPYGFVNKPISSELLLISIESAIYKHEIDKKLAKSEEKYRQIIETTHEGVSIATPEKGFIFVNQRMCEMLGYNEEEILGHKIFKFIDQDQIPVFYKANKKILNNEKFEEIIKFRKKDGSILWTLAKGSALLDDQGNYFATLGMHSDITKHKKNREK